MIKKICILYIVVFSFTLSLKSQDFNNIGISLTGGYGWVAPINDFVKGINPDNKKVTSMANLSLRLTKQVDGSDSWHYLYNGFYYGMGLFHGQFNYSKHLGNPFAVYGLIGFNFLNTKYFSLKSELALGISGIWQTYNNTYRYKALRETLRKL